jgi:hypothetical protein
MAAWVWVLIAVVIVVIVALVFGLSRKRRSVGLRQRFGSEYDRAVETGPSRRAAESDLRNRSKRRASIDVRPLTQASLERYAREWSTVQAQFVDQPTEAVRSADGLVHRVMSERGYPMDNFDNEADLISVDHPAVVDNFRSAHGVYVRAQAQQATTEDLRSAMLRYRSLFDQLLVSDTASPDSGIDTRAADGQLNGRQAWHPVTGPATTPTSIDTTEGAQQ